jgi:hypothetical protein
VTRFLLAFVRNCGVAIAISVFFAAAHNTSDSSRSGQSNRMMAAALHASTDAVARIDSKGLPPSARQ